MVYFLLASLLFPAGAKQSTQGHHLYMKVLSRIQPPRLYIYIYIDAIVLPLEGNQYLGLHGDFSSPTFRH